jgi:hypothetical protein
MLAIIKRLSQHKKETETEKNKFLNLKVTMATQFHCDRKRIAMVFHLQIIICENSRVIAESRSNSRYA